MKKIIILVGVLVLTLLTGCSPKYSPYANPKNAIIIYDIDKEEASDLAYKAIEAIVPSTTIGQMNNGMGFFATERFLIDEQTYSVKLVALSGTRIDNNRIINGFSFDVYSDGTLFHGPSTTKDLLNYTIKIFNETGTAVNVKNATPRAYTETISKNKSPLKPKVQSNMKLEDKLTRIKKMYKNGLITEEEYTVKRKQLLSDF